MAIQEIKIKFNTLTDAQKRRVHDETNIIKECGADCFFQETGCFVDDPDSYWPMRKMAMDNLKI